MVLEALNFFKMECVSSNTQVHSSKHRGMTIGLSTDEAIRKLKKQLRSVRSSHTISFYPNSRAYLLNGYVPYALFYIFIILFFFAVKIFVLFQFSLKIFMLWDVLMITSIAFASLICTLIVYKRTWSRKLSILKKIDEIMSRLEELRTADSKVEYVSKFLPHSTSYSFQWTFRDGALVNVPVCLLVDSDIIELRPGQIIPAECTSLCESQAQTVHFKVGDVYLPQKPFPRHNRSPSPIMHNFKTAQPAVVTSTPIIPVINEILSSQSQKADPFLRSTLFLCFKRGIIFSFALSVSFLLAVFCVCSSRSSLQSNASRVSAVHEWVFAASFMTLFTSAVIHLPILWIFILTFSVISLQHCIHKIPSFQHNSLHAGIRDLPTSSLDGKWFSCWPFFKVQANRFNRFWQDCLNEVYRNPSTNLEQLLLTLGTVSNVCFVDKKGVLSFSIPTPDKVFFFRNPTQHRRRPFHSTASFNYNHMHHHRSFSSTPQFPLTRKPRCNSQKESHKDSQSGLSETRSSHKSSVDFGTRTTGHPINDQNSGPRLFLRSTNSPLTPLTLDVTTPSEFIYTLHFVTPRWHHFLGSLKPIGLSLLLNNCQQHTREHYVEFADHLMAMTASLRQQAVKTISVADSSDSTGQTNPAQVDGSGETVAVVNSRCLCGLAYKIGFQRTVLDLFSFVASVGIFKPIEQQLTGQQSFRPPSGTFAACADFCSNFRASERSHLKDGTRALHIQEAYACAPKDAFREPIPMPNCFCVIARGRSGVGYQVFTQGSADLVSTLCENVWDGREIVPLTEADRGRILDFYNRNVSTAYCIAFSYAPLLRSLPLLPSRPPASIPGDTCAKECTHASDTEPVKSVVLELPVNFDLKTRLYRREYRVSRQSADKETDKFLSQPGNDVGSSREAVNRVSHSFTVPNGRCYHESSSITKPDCVCSDFACSTATGSQRLRPSRTVSPVFPHLQPHSHLHTRLHNGRPSRTNSGSSYLHRRTAYRSRSSRQLGLRVPGLMRSAFSCGSLCSMSSSDTEVNPEDLQKALSSQVFLGMLSLQYQAVPGVLEMIRKLNQACIRFVHFSQENQLRSRVFAERLGLEADWNCHISLAPEPKYQRKPRSTCHTSEVVHDETLQDGQLTVNQSEMPEFPLRCRLHRSLSTPCVCYSSSVAHTHHHHCSEEQQAGEEGRTQILDSKSRNDSNIHDPLVAVEGAPIEILFSRPSDSPGASCGGVNFPPTSKLTSSTSSLSSPDAAATQDPTLSSSSSMSTSENSPTSSADEAPSPPADTSAYNYVFSNKSRLPCGIKNIRWHLKNVDNVPLKVSLFTECTPPAVSEMIGIMQEYGETVCVVGSCLSMANTELFFRGDTSVAFLPVLPLVCGHDTLTAQNGRLIGGPDSEASRTASCKCQPGELTKCEGDILPFSRSSSTSGIDSSQPLMRGWRRDPQRKCGSIVPPARDSFDLEELRSSTQQVASKQWPTGRNQCPPSKLLDVAGQLIALGAPLVGRLDGTQFDLLQLITEAHASVNNIYLCLTFTITASAAAGLFYLLCFSVWPSMPFFMLESFVPPVSAASDSHEVLAQPSASLLGQFAWLPPVFVGSAWPLAYAPTPPPTPLLTQRPTNWNELLPYSAATVSYADQVYWLTLMVIPILSASLFGRTVDHRVPLRQPPFKKAVILSSKRCCRFALVTTLRFLPSVVICVLSGLVHLLLLCPSVGSNYACLHTSLPPMKESPNTAWVTPNATEHFLSECVRLLPSVILVESIVFYQFVLCLVVISFTYANSGQWFYQFRPSTNLPWLICSSLIVLSHSIYLAVFWYNLFAPWNSFHSAGSTIFFCSFLWYPVLLLVNEAVSWKEREILHAENRFAKLFFDTKLGMYSPV